MEVTLLSQFMRWNRGRAVCTAKHCGILLAGNIVELCNSLNRYTTEVSGDDDGCSQLAARQKSSKKGVQYSILIMVSDGSTSVEFPLSRPTVNDN